MPHLCRRISSFHLIIIGLSLLINHTPKSKPQNLASRKFHKILDDHIILHKTRGGSTSAPSFSASFCSLCTWSKVVILIEALAEIQKMWNCAIGYPEKPKIFFWALPTSHPVPLCMRSFCSNFGCKKMGLRMPKSKNGDHFLSPTIPKIGGIDFCFTRISFSGQFWANFESGVF